MTKPLQPAIRFKGFTDAWEQRKLGEIVTSSEYGLNAKSKEYDGVNKYLRITDIDERSHKFIDRNLASPEINLNLSANYKLQEGDLLLARTGASVGKSYLYNRDDGTVYFAGFLIRMRFKNDINSEFIFQNTLTDNYYRFVRITSQRSGQPGINANEFKNYKIYIPDEEEQKIVSCLLRKIDDNLTLHQRKLDQLNELKRTLLQKMFPKKDEKIPEYRFPGFTDAWEQRKLGEIASCSKGRGYSKKDIKDKGIPLILYGRLYTNYSFYINSVDTYAVPRKDSVISEGCEVIIPSSGETAEEISRASAIEKSGILIGGDLNILKPFSFINPGFLALELSNGTTKTELASKAQGKSVVHLHNSDIKQVLISYPLIEEQLQIRGILKKIEKTITLHQRKLELLHDLKKTLLQRLFV